MSTFALKIIAIIAMLIDHIGAIFISPKSNLELYLLFRGIGRIAFPIYIFLLIEGFHYTRNVKNYLKRLGVFALISEIPFDLAFYHIHYKSNIIVDINNIIDNKSNDMELFSNLIERLMKHQNIFFTLFLGLLLIYLMSIVEKKFQHNMLICNVLNVILTLVFCAAAFILKTDYDYAGILLIVAFYLFRGNKIMLTISLFIINSDFLYDIVLFAETGNLLVIISTLAVFSMIPIAFYNGKKGKDVKYVFYIFYPAHLLILFLISQLI